MIKKSNFSSVCLVSSHLHDVKGKVYTQAKTVAHQARANSGFCSMKQLELFLPPSPLDGMQVHRRVIPSKKCTSSHLYMCTWVIEQRHKKSSILPKNTTQCHRPAGLEPGPLNPESNALTMKPPHLLFNVTTCTCNIL